MWVFCLLICLSVMTQGGQKSVGPPEVGVRDSCEPPCEYWDMTLGPLEKQPLLLPTKLSLQTLLLFLVGTYSIQKWKC